MTGVLAQGLLDDVCVEAGGLLVGEPSSDAHTEGSSHAKLPPQTLGGLSFPGVREEVVNSDDDDIHCRFTTCQALC